MKKLSEQQENYLTKFKQAQSIQSNLEEATAGFIKAWKNENPELAKEFVPTINIVCRPKGQAGASKAIPLIAERMFWVSNIGKPMSAITADVQALLPSVESLRTAGWGLFFSCYLPSRRSRMNPVILKSALSGL